MNKQYNLSLNLNNSLSWLHLTRIIKWITVGHFNKLCLTSVSVFTPLDCISIHMLWLLIQSVFVHCFWEFNTAVHHFVRDAAILVHVTSCHSFKCHINSITSGGMQCTVASICEKSPRLDRSYEIKSMNLLVKDCANFEYVEAAHVRLCALKGERTGVNETIPTLKAPPKCCKSTVFVL